MEGILKGYQVTDPTWFYLSLLLIVAVLFRFNRLFSARNLDLVLLLALTPGLLMIDSPDYGRLGYAWLFSVTFLLLVRLFFDSRLTRRPRLAPNLNAAGLAFLGVASFVLLSSKAITEPLPEQTVETVRRSSQLLRGEAGAESGERSEAGPVSPILATPATAVSSVVGRTEVLAARILAVLAHSAVIAGLMVVGRRHFDDPRAGVAMATVYLLLPCTSYDVGEVNHVLPAALIVWAFVFYRDPMAAGGFLGLACGTLFFPIFLLPLWASFYPRCERVRFCSALLLIGGIVLGFFALLARGRDSFMRQTLGSIDLSILPILGGREVVTGFWTTENAAYLIPVFAAYVVMLVVLTFLPRRKNLEHLLAHSTAIVVGTQFWYPREGGVYVLWYLPLMLMVACRPRLAHLWPPGVEEEQTERAANGRRRTAGAIAT